MSQSAYTSDADADADEDVDVVLDSLCLSCPPTIVDGQCKVNLIVGVLVCMCVCFWPPVMNGLL